MARINPEMIGVYDSGIGGLSIWQEIRRQRPDLSITYIADQAYAPYGELDVNQIKNRAVKVVDFFQKLGIKTIVVACNTATVSATINDLRRAYKHLSFVGVEPPVKLLATMTKTQHIALLATLATSRSDRLRQLIDTYAKGIRVEVVTPIEWVPLIESGKHTQALSKPLITKYLQPLLSSRVDVVGLGCTHYYFLKQTLEKLSKGRLNFVDVGKPVASRISNLIPLQTRNPGVVTLTFCTTSTPTALSEPLKNLLGVDTAVESITI